MVSLISVLVQGTKERGIVKTNCNYGLLMDGMRRGRVNGGEMAIRRSM